LLMRVLSLKFVVGSSLLLSSFASLADAQTSGGSGLDEIVVTARRVEERLQDVPISITVFNQDQLTNNNVSNAEDLANLTPSLSVNNNFGSDNATFAIRGFVQDAGTPPSVGVYFADVVAPRGPTQGTQAGDTAGPGSFFDLSNIQVLKGPQGTLFGRNTTGGAILLVPQKPTGRSEGYVEATTGNFGELRIQAALNEPINDSARFRIAIDHQKRDGYLNNISGIGPTNYDDLNYFAVRASLVLDISSNIENYTIASYSKSDTNGSVEKLTNASPVGLNPTSAADIGAGLGNFLGMFSAAQLQNEQARGAGFYDVEAAVANPESRVETWQLINTTSWHVNDGLTIKNIASYAEFTDFQRSPLFGTNWNLNSSPGLAAYKPIFFAGFPNIFTGVFPAPGLDSADQDTYTEELQFQGNALSNKLTYQAGVYAEWSDPLSPVGNQSQQLAQCADLTIIDCSDPIGTTFTALSGGQAITRVGAVNYTVGETTFRDRGIYTQDSYAITDQLKITGGARYTWDTQDNTAQRITYQFPVGFGTTATTVCTDPATTPNGCNLEQKKDSSKPTWLVDLDYKPYEDMLLYGKYARGYRAGGVITNAPVDHRTFNPEKVDNYEIGMKTSFAEPIHASLNIDGFYNNFSNQQLQFGFNAAQIGNPPHPAPVSPTTAIINAGKSKIYGSEIELALQPLPGLSVDFNYTYLRTQIVSVAQITTTDPNYQPATSIPQGAPLVLSPENKGTLSTKYTLPLEKSIGDISVGGSFIYVDKQLASYNYLNPAVVAGVGCNCGTLGPRQLLNLNGEWASIFGSTVDVSVFATNVTQKKYYQFVPGLGSPGNYLEFASVGEPRFYGLRVRYRFGT
jgi:iron complex outermembrane recepter protein